jgi:hypothetical protein
MTALLLCRGAALCAAEPEPQQAAMWRVQRVFVPADHPEEWPRETAQHYLAMPADEFESRLAQLRNSTASAQPPAAQLLRANYTAEFTGHDLRGELTWEFEHRADQRTTVRLGDCKLPLDELRWVTGSASSDERAIVGNDQNGRLAAVIDRTGKMSGRWSLRGQRGSEGALSFRLQLPACPFNVLQLTLPAELAPVVDHGLVSDAEQAAPGRRRWQIELGGNCHLNLRIVPRTAVRGTPEKTFVQQSFTYEFSEHGLESNAELRLHVLGAPISQIRLLIDQPLTVVGVRWGETELPLSAVSMVQNSGGTPDASSKPNAQASPQQEVLVALPKPMQGADQTVHITAIAPVPWTTSWRLPLVQLKNADWQCGALRLVVPDSVLLAELSTIDCHQTDLEVLPESTPGEAVSVALFNDHPQIQLALSPRREELRLTQGTSVSLRPNEGTGRYRGNFTTDRGERFTLQAEIAPQWIIESVESTPAGMIADWSQQSARNRPGKLTLQLNTPLTPHQGVEILVAGRRRSAPSGETLRADDLAMLHFFEALATRRLIHVQTAEAYQLELHGAGEIDRLDPAQLSATDAGLLDEKPTGLVFVDNAHARNLAVLLVGKTPQFDADTQLQALVSDDRLTETYRFGLTPHGREVSRFDVRFSQPRGTPMSWSIEGEPTAAIAARRLTEGESTGANWPGEVWEVTLPAPRASAFTLLATRNSPLADDMPPALASFIEAETQRGTIEVISVGHNLPEVHSRRLKTIPVNVPPADQYATAVAAFRYNPEEDTLLSADPPLVLIPRGNSLPQTQAWIWQAELTSRYSQAGAEHTLVCNVESAGLEKILFQPPPGATLHSAWIDGQQAADTTSVDGSSWRINLPAGQRFVTVVLQYSDEQAKPATIATQTAAWPSCDVPILARQWNVWTPPGTVLADAEIGNRHVLDVPWTKRLFGPLARATPQPSQAALTVAQSAPAGGLQSPWKTAPQISAFDAVGWIKHRFDGTGSSDRVWVVGEQSLIAWAWSFFVLAIAFRWWLEERALSFDLALLAVAAAVALTVPAAWAPLFAAAWLGLVAGRLTVWITQHWQLASGAAPLQTASASTTTKLVAGTVGMLLIGLVAYGVAQAKEEAAPAGSSSGSQPVQKVLIPVDSQRRPTGGLYYVPEALRTALLRSGDNATAPSYLITSAKYLLQQERNSNSKSSGVPDGNCQAIFEIELLAEHAEVQLPIGFEGAVLVPNSVQVDGQAAEFRSDEKQPRLLVALQHAGSHRLELQLHPIANSDGFNFAVPPVADSKIDLGRLGTTGPQPEISSALGSTVNASGDSAKKESERDRSPQMVWLGPAGKIEWLAAAASSSNSSPAAAFDADDLFWLHISPAAVVVNARLHLHVHAGSIQQLHLLADARWRPILDAESTAAEHRLADAVAISRIQPAAENPNEFVIDLARPVAGQATVALTLQLNSRSGIGNLQALAWKVGGAGAEHRWWGLSVEPGLEYAISDVAERNRITPEKFTALWPTRDSQPQAAWSLIQPENSARISTWLRRPTLTARCELAAIAGQKEIELHWAARVAVSNGSVFQYRLHVPPQMAVDRVSVLDRHVDQPCRWSRNDADLLSIFLDSAASGEREVLVRGRMPLPTDAKFTLPQITVEDAASDGFRALALRQPETLVTVTDTAGLKRLSESDFAAAIADAQLKGLLDFGERPSLGRQHVDTGNLVAALDGEQGYQPVQLAIVRNQPQLEVQQVTTLDRSAETWRATVDLDLHIAGGMVDVLRFDLPANWVGPFEISPAMPQFVEDVPGENRRQLVLRPEAPLQHEARLQIHGPLTIAAGQRPSAPDVRLLGAARQARFLSLPRRLENQQLAWDTRGLLPARLPAPLATTASDPSAYRWYQLIGDRSRAVLRSADRSSESSQVRSVDMACSWDSSGAFRGVAAFDVESAGASSCELQLPVGEHLIQARLDAVPAQLSTLGENHWNVWLGDNKLPRHLEIIFTGVNESTAANSLLLAAPTLVELPVERTLWSVWAPPRAGEAVLPQGAAVSALRLRQLRLEGDAAFIDPATGVLLDESTEDVARWYVPWLRRYLASRADLIQAKSVETAADQVQAANAELNALEQEQLRLARKLNNSNPENPGSNSPAPANQGTTVTEGDVANSSATASDWLHLFAATQPAGHGTAWAMVRGQGGPLAIQYPRLTANDWRWRWAAAFGVLAATSGMLLAWWLGLMKKANFHYGPQLLGVAAGLVWSLWLSPGLLGAAIIAVSLYLVWHKRSLRMA